MAYSTNTLSLLANNIGGRGHVWLYETADAMSAVLASGYISDAGKKRMQAGDLVFVFSGALSSLISATPSLAAAGVTSEFASGVVPVFQPCIVSSISAFTLQGNPTQAATATLAPVSLPAPTAAYSNPRNLIDGGDFTTNPWQRGTVQSAAVTNTVAYMADRFFTVGGGSGSQINWSRQADNAVAGFSQALRWQRQAANTDVNKIYFGQVLETADSIRAQGQFLTLQMWNKCGANFLASSSSFTAQIIYGTGTDQSAASLVAGTWTGYTVAASATITPTTVDQLSTLSTAAVIPATATQVGVLFSYTPSGTAGANEYLQFKGFQLEIGPEATTFEHTDVQIVLEICQRYAYVINEPNSGVIVGTGSVSASNTELFYLALPVQMRTAPTVTVPAVGSFKVNSASGGLVAATGLTGNATHTVNAIGLTATGTGTAGQAAMLQGGGGAGQVIASADY